MLRLGDFMEIQKLHHDGVSVSEIARQLNMDRKIGRRFGSICGKHRASMNGSRRSGRSIHFVRICGSAGSQV